MSKKKKELSGYSRSEAVFRLLQMHGYENNLTLFNDMYSIDCMKDMVAALDSQSLPSRHSVINNNDIPHLQLPSIVECNDKSWVVIETKKGNRYIIDSASGKMPLKLNEIGQYISDNFIELLPALPDGNGLWDRLVKLIGLHKKAFMQVIATSLLLQLMMLVIPELTGIVLNRALPDSAGSILMLVSLGIVTVSIYQAWIGWIRGLVMVYINSRLEVAVQRGFLDHLIHLPFPFLQRKTLGEFLQAFRGLSASKEFLGGHAIPATFDGIFSVILLITMFIKLPMITMVIVGIAVVMSVFSVIIGRFQVRLQGKEVSAQARQQGYLSELINGHVTIKAAGAEKQGLYRWMRFFGEELAYSLKKNRLELYSETGLSTIQQSIVVMILVWGGYLCLNGKTTIGTVFAFLQLSSGFLGAVFGVINFYLMVVLLKPQLIHTREILSTKTPADKRYLSKTRAEESVSVVMKDVWFRYTPDGPWVLKGYNLDVKAGEQHVFNGVSGSGKSTILRLLSGLYTPEKGTVSIGNMRPEHSQQKLFYLPQFVQLYAGSIMENLKIFSGDVNQGHLMGIASETGLDEIVSTFPMKYETIVTHGGKNLSGGQRQLIALSAILAGRRSLVLLDEPMANIDAVRSAKLHCLIDSRKCTVILAQHNNK